MKTIDIHSHLLNPNVRFNRLYDRLAIRFFAKKLGISPQRLQADPYNSYVEAMTTAVRESRYVEKACLFGVDSRLNEKGEETARDGTVCAHTEDVLAVADRFPDQFIPFFSINPLRPDALDLIDEYVERGCRGAKFLQNYWGLNLSNERFLPYFEKLKALEIPLIIHIGSEYTIESFAPFERVEMLDLPLAVGVKVIAAIWVWGVSTIRFFCGETCRKIPTILTETTLLCSICCNSTATSMQTSPPFWHHYAPGRYVTSVNRLKYITRSSSAATIRFPSRSSSTATTYPAPLAGGSTLLKIHLIATLRLCLSTFRKRARSIPTIRSCWETDPSQ